MATSSSNLFLFHEPHYKAKALAGILTRTVRLSTVKSSKTKSQKLTTTILITGVVVSVAEDRSGPVIDLVDAVGANEKF
jgi:hypothetical protein